MNSYRVVYLKADKSFNALTRWLSKSEAIEAASEFENLGTPSDELAIEDAAGNMYRPNGDRV